MKKYMMIGLLCLSVCSYAMESKKLKVEEKATEEETMMGPEQYAYAVMARLREEQKKPSSKIISDAKPQQERRFGRGSSGPDAKL